MDGIKIDVTGNIARVIEKPKRITSGTVGLPVEFTFDSEWAGLGKTAVFMAGCENIIVDGVETSAIVPWEALRRPGVRLSIGVFGVNADGSVAIPTVYATVGPVCQGAEPGHTTSVEPKLPIWKQLLNMIGNLLGLKTNAKDNLVDAINEVHDKVDNMQPGKSPQNYILTGIFDQDGKVRLSNFNWDELVAAITAGDVYVAARLTSAEDDAQYEYVFTSYEDERECATFVCVTEDGSKRLEIHDSGMILHSYTKTIENCVGYRQDYKPTWDEKRQARENIDAAPKSYILHGTIDDDNNVTLTDFNWDELVAAITSEDNIYVAARLTQYGTLLFEFTLASYSPDEDFVVFAHNGGGTMHSIDVYSDGAIDYYERFINTDTWTCTLEDGSTVEKKVYVG